MDKFNAEPKEGDCYCTFLLDKLHASETGKTDVSHGLAK